MSSGHSTRSSCNIVNLSHRARLLRVNKCDLQGIGSASLLSVYGSKRPWLMNESGSNLSDDVLDERGAWLIVMDLEV